MDNGQNLNEQQTGAIVIRLYYPLFGEDEKQITPNGVFTQLGHNTIDQQWRDE